MAVVRGSLPRVWSGPQDLSEELKLEWRLCLIRWPAMILVGLSVGLVGLTQDRQLVVYSILLVSAVYNLLLHVSILRQSVAVARGYVTTLGDGALTLAVLLLAGGFNSPFYYILYPIIITVAMRYGARPALLMALVFCFVDAVMLWRGGESFDALFLFRSTFLCITASLSGYLREQTKAAEAALESELHQANLFGSATGTLDAGLDLPDIARSIMSAACSLCESRSAVLLLSVTFTGDEDRLLVAHLGEQAVDARVSELEAICRQAALGAQPGSGRVRHHQLFSGDYAVVMRLADPSQAPSPATLVVGDGRSFQPYQLETLERFAEHAGLVLETVRLYSALSQRSQALQTAYAELEQAHAELVRINEIKTNFLANVSHEFRTPLTSIRAFAELLQTYSDPSVRTEFLETINQESERLSRMVDDVLDITKIESGSMDWRMRPVDVVDLVRQTTRPYVALAQGQNVTLDQDLGEQPAWVVGDRDRLQQVLRNLLDNALKFTASGSISVTVRLVEDRVCVSVADTGIGIPAMDVSRIFDKFQQLTTARTDMPRGAGLGLAICAEIVEHHGGRIWVESELGCGSTFLFTLPKHGC